MIGRPEISYTTRINKIELKIEDKQYDNALVE
jgi:hypothetical protein